jgi:hypothetical protein
MIAGRSVQNPWIFPGFRLGRCIETTHLIFAHYPSSKQNEFARTGSRPRPNRLTNPLTLNMVTLLSVELTMNIANTLAVLMGSALVIVGITIFNKSYFNAVMTDLANNKGLLWLTGLITFVMGAVIVALYNVWSADWRVLVTILGWLTAIKGAVIMLLPSSMMLVYRRFLSDHLLMYSGFYALILGGLLLLLGFTR